MKKKDVIYFHAFLVIVFTLTVSVPAYAYIDPGTGSVIYQALVVIFIAVAATGRLWWTKLKGILGGNAARLLGL